MSISPPPFSPPRFPANEEDNNSYVNDGDDDDEYIDSPRTLISSFDLYKNAIDRLRSSVTSQSIEQQQSSLDHFKPLSTRTNAWLYMRIHDDLFTILLDYLLIENLPIQSTVLSIFANIACEQASHEQIFETNLIEIVCRKIVDIDQIDITNRCFRLLGNICSIEDAARKMIEADLTRSMGNVLRTCTDAACLHSTIRCSRKLSTYTFCRERMLDSMCLLSICKQLFSEKVALRKEAMKAVLEWDIDASDRSRSQLCEGEIFRFLITTMQGKSDKEYRHIAFRLLNSLLRYSDMRTEFGIRNGLDFLLETIHDHQYQSTHEHLRFIGLYCVCCQETNNRRLIKDDTNKMKLFFDYLEKCQYRSNFLDLLLTAIGQFIFDEQALNIFVKNMQFIERMCHLLESAILVKYEKNEQKTSADDGEDSRVRKKLKTKHTTDVQQQCKPVMIEFNERLFTEFVENTHLDDERSSSTASQTVSTNTNIEIRRRTEALIFALLSKLSYETTDKTLRRYLYNRRLVSLLIRYIHLCDEPNPRAIRIISRLTKMNDCLESLIDLGLPYLIALNFKSNVYLNELNYNASSDDQYLLNILLNDNRAFFQRLSWTNEENYLKTIEYTLVKNIEDRINTPYAINEITRRLNDLNADDKFNCILTLVATLRENNLKSILFQKTSGYNYLIDQSNAQACFWACRTIARRCISSNKKIYLTEFLDKLKSHCQVPSVDEIRTVELNINNEQMVTVNTDVLCLHSDYFKTLFNGPFAERNQSTIPIHLPETIQIESFVHLYQIFTHKNNDIINRNLTADLFRLCDRYVLDYLPYRLVHYVLEEFINGITCEFVDIASKPNLVSSLVRAIFCHLLTSDKNISEETFSNFMTNYSDELLTLIRSLLEHKCWFHDEYSPFSS